MVGGPVPVSGPLLVIGLGNPGPQYAATRHNIGQMAIAELGHRLGFSFGRHTKANALVAEGRLRPGGPRIVLAAPLSFMNLSGGPTSQLLKFYDLGVENLLVAHDELDIPFDTVRLKSGGGHGGHNGLRDIIAATGSSDFARLRIGIGRPPGRQDAADFVLKPFVGPERETLPILVGEAADAIELVAEHGLLAAQQRVHAPKA